MRAVAATLAVLALVAALAGAVPRPATAAPASITVGPAGDTYVYADPSAAGRAFGAAPSLAIGVDEFEQEQYALLSFDLAAIPAGAPIASAKLGLYLLDAPQALDVRVEHVDAAWDAGAVTWNTRPPSTPAGISRALGPGKGVYVEWEIGPLVAEWRALRRPRSNFGLALRGPDAPSLGAALASAESATPPRLTVTYTPVTAIDLRVALEWEPGSADALGPELAPGCPAPTAGLPTGYRANLQRGLEEAARYLYTMSEGQVTLGSVTIGTDVKAWQEADVRVLASSGYRPSAYVGGIVDAPRVAATPGGQPVLHYPAPVFLGRLWDGAGARCGGWAEAEGWRTIGHELAHFALFLYDQYQNVRDGGPQYCATADLAFLSYGRDRAPATRAGRAATLMAYQYSADKLWRGEPPAAAPGPRRLGCADTPHDAIYPGQSEWDVLTHFYPALRAPAGPARTDWDAAFAAEVAPRAILRVRWAAEATTTDSTAAVSLAALPGAGLVGEAYLVREGSPGVPQRIVGQGWRLPGEAAPPAFLGATAGAPERAAIFVAGGATGARYAVPLAAGGLNLADGAVNRVAAAPSAWRPTLRVTPVVAGDGSRFAEVTGLNVELADCAQKTTKVDLTYCPAGGACDNPVRLSREADGRFRHRLGPYPADGRGEPPALYGYLHARSLDTGEEYISWYQIGGGVGPAHIHGHAPNVDGGAAVEAAPGGADTGRDNRVLLAPAPVCAAAKLPAGVAGLIGAPLGVQVEIASNPQLQQPQRGWGAPGEPDAALRVRLSYDQALVDALGIDEGLLTILRFDAASGAWALAGEAGRSPELDWIAAAPRGFGGDGEIYALGYLAPRLFLPALPR